MQQSHLNILDLLRDGDAELARGADGCAQQRVPRRLERALLNSEVEVLELIVAELLKDLSEQRQRRVRLRLGSVLIEDGLQVAELAVGQLSPTLHVALSQWGAETHSS